MPPPPPERRRRRWPWLVLLVAVAGAAAVGGYVLWSNRDTTPDVYANPDSVELPPGPDDANPTVEYLNGPQGQLVVAFVTATAPLNDEVTPEVCSLTVTALEGLAAPTDVFDAAAQIPDQATAEMAVAHIDAVKRFLGACLAEMVTPQSDEVEFTSTVLTRRLEEFR